MFTKFFSFLKNFYGSHRIGASAGKTLLWLWLRKDLIKINGYLGVDLAGGDMDNKRFFSTKKYLCVDIDGERLRSAKAKHPDADIINQQIEDFLINADSEKGDVCLCTQTMGTNKLFNHDKTIQVIKLMYDYLNQGGSMVFNIACPKNFDYIKNEANKILEKRFETIDIKYYGAFHISRNWVPGFFRLFIAYVMDFAPPIRTLFTLRKYYIYFCCKNKI
tara:strand:+ start:1217 stop:1873 length:657 start_codon:yes stop_codon:yes gene_type:complete